ncbi:lasso peptide biosynthesis protein [Stenotrophomonas maltophilia]
MRTEWIENADRIAGHKRAAKNAQKVFATVLKLLHGTKWRGACHASSVITHIALKEMGVENTLVLGEAAIGLVHFDHSWVEVAGKPIDTAISMPLDARFPANPVFLGMDTETRLPTAVVYRASTGELDDDSMVIAEGDLGRYFDNFDLADGNFFTPLLMVLKDVGIRKTEDQLRSAYSSSRWTIKT